MLRCQAAGLLNRNAHLRASRPLARAGCRLIDPTKRTASSASTAGADQSHATHQTRQVAQATNMKRRKTRSQARKELLRGREQLKRLLGQQRPQETPAADTAGHGFVPMSDYEYERSLWEASQEPQEPPQAPPQPIQPLEEQQPQAEVPSPQAPPQPVQPLEEQQPQAETPSPQASPPDSQKSASASEGGASTKSESASKSRKKMKSANRAEDVISQISQTMSTKRSRLQKGEPVSLHKSTPGSIPFKPIEEHVDLQVPRLAHSLEKALFNPGVYHLQDPRSKVFNFDPYLTSIMPVDEFDFDALREYVSSSKDEKLHGMSKRYGAKYCGSTSSMTSVLSHFHYLISQWRKPAFPSITGSFVKDSDNFTLLTRAPASTFLHHNDGVYAMDADKEYDFGRENVLMMLGHSLEKLLTLPPEEFEKYRRTRSHLIPQETKDAGADAFHYGTIGKFMMRSQLDAHDPRLPGTGVFDIKTRAVFPIRIDLDNYADHVGYEIWDRFGQYESYEREYFDLIRAAFLRYSLQARIGRMDGCFVAYHNTRRIFGFQYVSISEMDQALHGTANPALGDAEFKLSVEMLEKLLDKATEKYPGRKLQITVETRETTPPVLLFFARPVDEEEIRASEAKAISIIDKAQHDMAAAQATPDSAVGEEQPETELGEEEAADNPSDSVDVDLVWEEMIAKVEEVIEDETMGVGSVRDAVQGALHENDLLSFENTDEQHPSLETLVEALVTEMSASRDSQNSTADVDSPGDINADTDGPNTVVETPTEDQISAAETDAEVETKPAPSTTARTKELKELILKFSKAVDLNAKQARGFERALADLLSRAKSQLDSQAEEAATEDFASEDQEQSPAADSATTAASNEKKAPPKFSTPDELYGCVVSVQNLQNGQPVKRPVATGGGSRQLKWTVNYTIHEMGRTQMESLYPAVKGRRYKVFGGPKKPFTDRNKLMSMSRSGANRRRKESKMMGKISVAWSEKPLRKSSVFAQANGQKTGKV